MRDDRYRSAMVALIALAGLLGIAGLSCSHDTEPPLQETSHR